MEALHSQARLGNTTQCSPQALPISPVSPETIKQTYSAYLDAPIFNVFHPANDPSQITYRKRKLRGDFSYVSNLETKIETFVHDLYAVKFFDPIPALESYLQLHKSHDTHLNKTISPMLYIVATYDPKKTSLEKSYQSCCDDVNLFVSRVSKSILKDSSGKPIKIKILRFFIRESHKSGMCHLNIVLLLEKPIHVFPYQKTNPDGELETTWRIQNKVIWNKIKSCWSHGFIDIQAVSSIIYGSSSERKSAISNGALSLKYLTKYLLKSVSRSSDRDKYPMSFLQYSMLWWTRMRAFSLPESFNARLQELVAEFHFDLIKYTTYAITKTAVTVSRPKSCFAGRISFNPMQFPERFDRWKSSFLLLRFETIDLSSHLSKFIDVPDKLLVSKQPKPFEFRTDSPARLVPSRHLTKQQAYDVFNNIDSHPEIPFSIELP